MLLGSGGLAQNHYIEHAPFPAIEAEGSAEDHRSLECHVFRPESKRAAFLPSDQRRHFRRLCERGSGEERDDDRGDRRLHALATLAIASGTGAGTSLRSRAESHAPTMS